MGFNEGGLRRYRPQPVGRFYATQAATINVRFKKKKNLATPSTSPPEKKKINRVICISEHALNCALKCQIFKKQTSLK